MGADKSYIEQGGSGCLDIRTYLLGGGAIGPAIPVMDMGNDVTYEEVVEKIPPQGVLQADGEATAEGAVQRLGLPPSGGGNGVGGLAGGGDIRLLPTEQISAIYCDYAYCGPVSGGKA